MPDLSLLLSPLLRGVVVAAALSITSVSSGAAYAAGPLTNNAATNRSAFQVEMRVDSGPNVLPARRAYLTAGTNRFAFLVPEGFRMSPAVGQEVQLASADNVTTITVGLLPGSTPLEKLSLAGCRDQLLALHPNARILAELSLSAANQAGPAFDFQWSGARDIPQAGRVAFIPSRAGTLQFCVSTSPEKLSRMEGELRYVMLTFCASDANGKLEVMPLSDKL